MYVLRYFVSTGEFFLAVGDDYLSLGLGYSGTRQAKNAVSREREKAVGPIPRGVWSIGLPLHHRRLGPLSFPLTAEEGTDIFGRSGFYIHGDNARRDFSASTGCIILERPVRDCLQYLVRWSGLRTLIVEE